jgi:hypothetical protein
MPLVARVRSAFLEKDAGSPDMSTYRGDRGRARGAPSAAWRHSRCFAKPSY